MPFKYQDVRFSKVVRAHDQIEAMQLLKPSLLVLVIPNKRPKSVKFICPCGCGEIISVNLMPETGKAWSISYDRKLGLSLWPSVWLTSGCRSHFIIRNNKARLLQGKMPKMSAIELEDWWSHSDNTD
jgi:hypothetical protein